MTRRPIHFVGAGAALGIALVPSAAVERGKSECTVTRILPDGREIRSIAGDDGNHVSLDVRADGGSTSASAASRGSESRSSVSVSSSSSSASGEGRSSSRAVSSYTDEAGRTVTTTRDTQGCRIVIDERKGE